MYVALQSLQFQRLCHSGGILVYKVTPLEASILTAAYIFLQFIYLQPREGEEGGHGISAQHQKGFG